MMASSVRRGVRVMAVIAGVLGVLGMGAAFAGEPGEGGNSATLARQLYQMNCMACHTVDGSGIAGKVPPLKHSLGFIAAASQAGREYVMRVPGASNSALTDAQLADVLNYILGDMNRGVLPAGFKPYTAAEIAAKRRPALTDVAVHRREIVHSLQAQGVDAVTEKY